MHESDVFDVKKRPGEIARPSLPLQIIDLGPNNIGPFGPERLSEAEGAAIVRDLARPQYRKPASKTWTCVDARLSAEQIEQMDSGESVEEADPQLAGGLVVSETAAILLDPDSEKKPLSILTADVTKRARSEEQIVLVHGDDLSDESGCKASVLERQALSYAAENADILAPKVWATCSALGLSQFLQERDVTAAITAGADSASRDELWDISPKQRAQIIVENGGGYVVLIGPHFEVTTRVDVSENGAFDKVAFLRDHSHNGQQLSAFSATFGCYQSLVFDRIHTEGLPDRSAALQVMRVVLFNEAMLKLLQTRDHQVGIVS